MTTNTKSNCSATDLCRYDSAPRTRFFHGMLLTDEDLRAEQAYHRNALKRVNRYLWGSGIVCGLEVEAITGLCIQVHPGAALDCDGNLIEVCKCTSIDLSKLCKDLYPGGCIPANTAVVTKYLVLRYAEVEAEPVPVQSGSDDCSSPGDGAKCQPSRYREGYCIEFADQCPNCEPCDEERTKRIGLAAALVKGASAYTNNDAKDIVRQNHPGCLAAPPCPACGCGNCAVGLAKLEIDCTKGEVKVTCECRDYVCSPRLTKWLVCELLGGLKEATRSTGASRLGAMLDARVVAGRPVSALWDIGATYAFSSEEGKRKLESDLFLRFRPQIERFAAIMGAQEIKELREQNTRLQTSLDDMHTQTTARMEDMQAQITALSGAKGKKG